MIEMTLEEVFKKLYKYEINFTLYTFWDNGYTFAFDDGSKFDPIFVSAAVDLAEAVDASAKENYSEYREDES